MNKLLGREQQQAQFDYLLESDKAEFIAVYGRRRVGKTYLITEHLRGKINFYASGVLNGNARQQKEAFKDALEQAGYPVQDESTWLQMFGALRRLLQARVDSGLLTVVFLDEVPCFDTQRSGFVAALDHFWNTWASHYTNMKLIVCGSATSWIISNIVDNHGGLHNRLTFEMHLHPFSLHEIEKYLLNRKIRWTRQMIMQAYMVFGGVPYYWSLIMPNESLAQVLDRLYSKKDGLLSREYERLIKSLFNAPNTYMRIIQALADSKQGLTRDELAANLGIKPGGRFSMMLEDLKNCDLIRSYRITYKNNSAFYQLTDMFLLFHRYFSERINGDEHYFVKHLGNPVLNTWQGLAFERVVMQHVNQVMQRLGIAGVGIQHYSWRSRTTSPAAQIDMILDRADGMLNICEIKYAAKQYILQKDEYEKIRNRIWSFQQETKTNKGILLTFVTPYGLQQNMYWHEVSNQVNMDDLFLPTRYA